MKSIRADPDAWLGESGIDTGNFMIAADGGASDSSELLLNTDWVLR